MLLKANLSCLVPENPAKFARSAHFGKCEASCSRKNEYGSHQTYCIRRVTPCKSRFFRAEASCYHRLTRSRNSRRRRDTNGIVAETSSDNKDKDSGNKLDQLLKKAGEPVKRVQRDFDPDDFSLPLAVALGACSFESYNTPYGISGVRETDPNGTQTIYMDKSFLEETIAGIMQVTVNNATGFEIPEGKEKLPVRCSFGIGPSTGEATAKGAGQVLLFQDSAFLYVRESESEKLRLEVVLGEKGSEQEESLGCSYVDLDDLRDGKTHDLHIRLRRPKGEEEAGGDESGTLHLACTYQENSVGSDIIDSVAPQAIEQMIQDDWGPASVQKWDSTDGASNPLKQVTTLFQKTDENSATLLAAGESPDRPEFKSWQELRKDAIARKLANEFTPIAFLANQGTDTEVWMYRNVERKELVVAFRGTSSPADMLTDMTLELAAFNPGHRPNNKSPEDVIDSMSPEELYGGPLGGLAKALDAIEKLPGMAKKDKEKKKEKEGKSSGVPLLARAQIQMLYSATHDNIWVHRGFLEAYCSVRDRIIGMAEEIMRKGKEDGSSKGEGFSKGKASEKGEGSEEGWRVYLTGHSMGGSLATLAAYEMSVKDWGDLPCPSVTMYSFGQPRVGNTSFANDYDKVVPDSWRVRNANDIVVTIPALLGYQHIGIEVKINEDGCVDIMQQSEQDHREGAVLSEILPKIQDGVFGDDPEAKKVVDDIVKSELEIWKTIVDGSAVKEHMEDMYHNIMKECVSASGEEMKTIRKMKKAEETVDK